MFKNLENSVKNVINKYYKCKVLSHNIVFNLLRNTIRILYKLSVVESRVLVTP